VAAVEPLGDSIALSIQELRRRQSRPRPLLRIDNRNEAAGAPFQFDTACALLHRRDCKAIPKGSRTALYGLWQIPAQAKQYACPVCKPSIDDDADETVPPRDAVTDYVYGFLSVLDQFGSVIRERGREFRESEEGRQLKAGLDGFYRTLEDRERATLQVVLSSLDGLLTTIADIDESLDGTMRRNGSSNGGTRRNGGDHP
jgi:hypothetical protein